MIAGPFDSQLNSITSSKYAIQYKHPNGELYTYTSCMLYAKSSTAVNWFKWLFMPKGSKVIAVFKVKLK